MRTALKIFRVQHNLSQDSMAQKLGFSRQHYARIENGEQDVSLRFLVKLGEVFGIELEKAKELTRVESV